MIGRKLPEVTFKTRVRDDTLGGPNPYRWADKSTTDYFKNKRVVLFSLPGAFTSTCTTYQLPVFEKLFAAFKEKGIDEIYCLSVNDGEVEAWFEEPGYADNCETDPYGESFPRNLLANLADQGEPTRMSA